MKTTDFSRTLIRCSSIGQIMTSPQGKSPRQKWLDCKADIDEQEKKFAALEERLQNMATGKKIKEKIEKLKAEEAELFKVKDLEPLSQTAKSYLAKVYAEVKYGKRSIDQLKGNKYTEKGKLVEEDGIDLLCHIERRMLRKNDERLTNEWLTGELDLFEGESIRKATFIWDIKCPFSTDSFFSLIGQPLNAEYEFQMQGYLDLTGCQEGAIAYTLVSAPAEMIQDELRKTFYKLGCVTEEDPRYIAAKREIVNNMTFDDMPPEHRLLQFPVYRDQARIDKIHEKVEQCRVYLGELERMHLGELLQEVKELEAV
jgi:hypothetical protein